jgi:hypothetical protein
LFGVGRTALKALTRGIVISGKTKSGNENSGVQKDMNAAAGFS